MYKLLSEFALKFLLANGMENSKGNALWRNLLVILILAVAFGLLQYSETMLNVRQIQAQHDIEQPVQLLEHRLQSCRDLLDNTEKDLMFCRSNVVNLPRPKQPLASN